jgi:hypothetical protein
MLHEIGRCDLESESGACRAYFANVWLSEAAGGHFGWRFGAGKEEVLHNRQVIESWANLWARTSGDERFWSGERAVDARYPRALMETASLAFIEEGQQHFATVEAALSWIQKQSQSTPMVYRSDGLAVGWSKNLSRDQLNVEVWQITIGGGVPTHLPGCTDEAIVVSN